MKKPLASIIINNYNYGHFLSEAIESALNQDYQPTEVIVVDDGSTDNSRQVIADYGERIIPVLKENGGQGSAFNSGFEVSQGEAICFLDADDVLLPSAIGKAVELLRDPNVAKVHWPLSAFDAHGNLLGKLIPEQPLSEGDLREAQIKCGIEGHIFSPTSGNAWSRSYLEKILPLPESRYGFNADSYLAILAPFSGNIKRITEYQGLYRIHAYNGTSRRSYNWRLNHYYNEVAILREYLEEQGIQFEDAFEGWKGSYYQSLERMVQLGQELEAFIPTEQEYILVDMNEFGQHQLLSNSQSIPFLEKDGLYWGPPADDATAIGEFERLHRAGANFIVFGWPAFWWLDYYVEFAHYLRNRFRCVLDNERLIVFDLRISA